MTIKSITATFHHPYPTYKWFFRLAGDEDAVWLELTDDNYPAYIPGDQDGDGGRTTYKINITSPQQGRDEAWFKCTAYPPHVSKYVESDIVYISIGPLEWSVGLPVETKTIDSLTMSGSDD